MSERDSPTSFNESPKTTGKLILYVSDPPSNSDLVAKQHLQELDPSVEVISVSKRGSITTPRLDAIEYNHSRYRGVESILSFIRVERRKVHDSPG